MVYFILQGIRNAYWIITEKIVISRFKDEVDVVGFPSNVTLEDQSSRKDFLYDIIRDIHTVSKCQAVVCGLTSNVKQIHLKKFLGCPIRIVSWTICVFILQVCRLILEMLASRYFDCDERIISIDGVYSFLLWTHLLPHKVNRI
jgi:hypothetical protein